MNGLRMPERTGYAYDERTNQVYLPKDGRPTSLHGVSLLLGMLAPRLPNLLDSSTLPANLGVLRQYMSTETGPFLVCHCHTSPNPQVPYQTKLRHHLRT